MGSCFDHVLEKYNIADDTVEISILRKILDLDNVAETELDWYSTRTFEVFLDALDINQSVILEPRKHKTKDNKTDIPALTKEFEHIKKDTSNQLKTEEDRYSGVETILSAEALKILSELPDLSQMTATRSFIFPNGGKSQTKQTK